MSFLLYKYSIISKNMHFHAGQPFQLHSPCKNTPVCKFTENGKKVKPAIIFCRYGPSLKERKSRRRTQKKLNKKQRSDEKPIKIEEKT